MDNQTQLTLTQAQPGGFGPALPDGGDFALIVSSDLAQATAREGKEDPMVKTQPNINAVRHEDGSLELIMSPSTVRKENTVRLNSLADLGRHFGIAPKPVAPKARNGKPRHSVDVATLEKAIAFNEGLAARRKAKAYMAIAMMVVVLQEINRLRRQQAELLVIFAALVREAKRAARRAAKPKRKKAWQPGVKRAAKVAARAKAKPVVAAKPRLELVTVEVRDFALFSAARRVVRSLSLKLKGLDYAVAMGEQTVAIAQTKVAQVNAALVQAEVVLVDEQAKLVVIGDKISEAIAATHEIDAIAGKDAPKVWDEASAYIAKLQQGADSQLKTVRTAEHARNRQRNLVPVYEKAVRGADRKLDVIIAQHMDVFDALILAENELKTARTATKTINKLVYAKTPKRAVGCADHNDHKEVNPMGSKPKSLMARLFQGLADFFEARHDLPSSPVVATPVSAVSATPEAKMDKAVATVVDTNKAISFHVALKGAWRGTMADGDYSCINAVGGVIAAMSANGAFISPWIIAINGERNVGINIVGIVFYTDGVKTAIKVKTKTPYATDIYNRIEGALFDRERKIAAELIAAGMPKEEAEGKAILKIAELYPQVIFTGKLVPASRERLVVKHGEASKKHLNRTIEIGVMKMTQMVDMQVVFRGEPGWLEYTPDDGEAITEQDVVKGSSRATDFTSRSEIEQAVQMGLLSRDEALELIMPTVAKKLKKLKSKPVADDREDGSHAEEIPTAKEGPKSGSDTKADDALDNINFKSSTGTDNPPDAGTVI